MSGPALAHAGHEAPVAGPVWLPVVVALAGGWLLAAPERRRQPAVVAAALLLLVGPSWPDLWRAAHVGGAGLWGGAVLQVLRRPGRPALRAAAPTAVGGAALACGTGLLAAVSLGVDLSSPYGHLLLYKGIAVVGVLGAGALVVRRPRLVRVEALGLAVVLLLGTLLATRPLLPLPDGVVVAESATVLVAHDASGRRFVRVAPATARVEGVALTRGVDGSGTARLGAQRRLRVDGTELRLPTAVPLAGGPGDVAERLARTLAGELARRPVPVVGAPRDVADVVVAARARGLQRPVVLVDGDPRGADVARRLGLPAVDVRSGELGTADLVLVATSWRGAARGLELVRGVDPIGGAVVLPWLVGAVTADAARTGGLQLLSDAPLEGSAQLSYRNALRRLPGERPSLVGLAGWSAGGPGAVYAASPAGVLPALFSHDHDDHDDHEPALPAWVAAGGLTAVSRLGGTP